MGRPLMDSKLYQGYIKVPMPDHPTADKDGFVYQHKLVMEDYLGEILPPGFIVHHIDHNTQNNHVDNLLLIYPNAAHSKLHGFEKINPQAYTNLLKQLKYIQSMFKSGKHSLSDFYNSKRNEIKETFEQLSNCPELTSLIAEDKSSRLLNLRKLSDNFSEEKIIAEINYAIKSLASNDPDLAWELLFILGEIKIKQNINFIFDFLYDNYDKIKEANTIIQGLIAIYKLCKSFPDYGLNKRQYLVLCKAFTSKSKNAILFALKIINTLNIKQEIKENLYNNLNQNKLYFQSRYEFDKLLHDKTYAPEDDPEDMLEEEI